MNRAIKNLVLSVIPFGLKLIKFSPTIDQSEVSLCSQQNFTVDIQIINIFLLLLLTARNRDRFIKHGFGQQTTVYMNFLYRNLVIFSINRKISFEMNMTYMIT